MVKSEQFIPHCVIAAGPSIGANVLSHKVEGTLEAWNRTCQYDVSKVSTIIPIPGKSNWKHLFSILKQKIRLYPASFPIPACQKVDLERLSACPRGHRGFQTWSWCPPRRLPWHRQWPFFNWHAETTQERWKTEHASNFAKQSGLRFTRWTVVLECARWIELVRWVNANRQTIHWLKRSELLWRRFIWDIWT